MRGLAKGEQSSVTNPVLQLFIRSGGMLVDPYAATYKIEDISTLAVSPVTRVAQTALVLATYKLGTGRYAIPTGATTSWSLGTHRVICTYQLTNGGATYTQVIDFEVLDSVDWPSSQSFTSYLSTRKVWQDALIAPTISVQTLHRQLSRIAQRIEGWCRRFFEPRYLVLRKSGRESSILQLDEAIIALESIEAIWQLTTGEDSLAYDSYLYKVFNRHLDGGHDVDDRYNPKVELISIDNTALKRLSNGFVWAAGTQNIRLKGVFGYTDPQLDPLNGRTLIGQTPEDIAYVSGILLARALADPSLSDPATAQPGAIQSYRTRHQAISFFGPSGGGGGGGGRSGMSGDPLVDDILIKYGPPMNVIAA